MASRFKYRSMRWMMIGISALTVAVILSEAAYWSSLYGVQPIAQTGDCAVLILGYPTESDGTPHPIQTLRVRAGVSAYREHRCGKIVFSGGAVRNRFVEAETMAEVARHLGVLEHGMVLEGRSRTTWENIGCSAPLLEKEKRVLLVSDSLHVHRAKAYACRQNPSLCAKLSEVGVNPPITLFWWKVPAAAHEFQSRLRDFLFYRLSGLKNEPFCPA